MLKRSQIFTFFRAIRKKELDFLPFFMGYKEKRRTPFVLFLGFMLNNSARFFANLFLWLKGKKNPLLCVCFGFYVNQHSSPFLRKFFYGIHVKKEAGFFCTFFYGYKEKRITPFCLFVLGYMLTTVISPLISFLGYM